jgi:bacteriorhodopsin
MCVWPQVAGTCDPRVCVCAHAQTSVIYHLLSLMVSVAVAVAVGAAWGWGWLGGSGTTVVRVRGAQITLIAAMAYLVMALEIGDIWVRYADWLLSTPLLLVDLACEWSGWRCGGGRGACACAFLASAAPSLCAVLAGMPSSQVLFLASVDMMMVGSGFAAQMAYKAEQKWPMFVFSCFLFGVIVVTLVQYMRSVARESAGTVEAKAYRFLSIWTLALWSIYPILFILDNTKTIGGDIEAIIHCVLDVLAKGEWGGVRAREGQGRMEASWSAGVRAQASLA